jgi:hypothetical protein
MGEAADGVAGQSQSAGDRPQAEPLVQQSVDGRVLFAHPVGQTAGLSWLIRGRWRRRRVLQGLGGADRGGVLRLAQEGAVLDDRLLDGLGQVFPDVPPVRDVASP